MIPADVLNDLCDNRSDPYARAVYEDALLTEGAKVERTGLALWIMHAADAADTADTDAADTADADAADAHRISQLLSQEPDMSPGLKLIQIPGRYGYSVTRVGWMHRVAGDEWAMLPGAVTVVRTAGARTLDSLASEGPKRDHTLSSPSKIIEEIHRLVIRRSMPADEKAWGEYVAKPEGWES